jgi:hypothetical protein
MAILITLIVFLTFSLTSCTNNKPNTTLDNVNTDKKNENRIKDNPSKPISKNTDTLTDTIHRFIVDDFPISYEMMAEQKVDNSSSYTKTSGKTKSIDMAWFSNDTLNQTLIFELYTDGHRLLTYHFYNSNIPAEIINRIELHTYDGEIATRSQKQQDFNGFLKQTVKISSNYFTTDKGFKLGDSKQKVLKIYGPPDERTEKNGIEKFEWNFVGDLLYDGIADLKGKPLAKYNYGHQAFLFFKNGKLIGQIFRNDIP